MKIIDNKKDYYDYLSGIYGIDDLIVYDRRGSIPYRDILYNHPLFFDPTPTLIDEPHKGYIPPGSELKNYYSLANLLMIVEIGAKHYYIKVKRYRIHETDPISISYIGYTEEEYFKERFDNTNNKWMSQWHLKYNENEKKKYSKKFSDKPLAISFEYIDAKDWYRRNGTYVVENPILKDIPGISGNISAEDVWRGIYDYISSTKDKIIVDNRTDIQKLESAGFDKKTSFRKM